MTLALFPYLKTLELHNGLRTQLLKQKIESINAFVHLCTRWKEASGTMKLVLEKEIEASVSKDAEFSGMLLSILKQIRDEE